MTPSMPAKADLVVQVLAGPTVRVDFAVLLARRGEIWRARVEARVHFRADLAVLGFALEELALPRALARADAARAVGARLVADIAREPALVADVILAAMRRALETSAASN